MSEQRSSWLCEAASEIACSQKVASFAFTAFGLGSSQLSMFSLRRPTEYTSEATRERERDVATLEPAAYRQFTKLTACTRQEIAKHGSAQSLWLTVDGSVYDVTRFQAKHPGGQHRDEQKHGCMEL
eukprot:5651080-Amphidinium_carterae.2